MYFYTLKCFKEGQRVFFPPMLRKIIYIFYERQSNI